MRKLIKLNLTQEELKYLIEIAKQKKNQFKQDCKEKRFCTILINYLSQYL